MKKRPGYLRLFFPALGLLLALTACAFAGDAPPSAPPVPTPAPAPAEPPEQIAVRWLSEENHDAIQVGVLPGVWVSAEYREAETEDGFEVTLSVWDPERMDRPIQTITKSTQDRGFLWTADANFDGMDDLCWRCRWGNQPTYSYLWIWDEVEGRFIEDPAFAEISMPEINREAEQITGWARSSGAGTGLSTIHRWIGGGLTCVRRIEAAFTADSDYRNVLLTVEDWNGITLAQVYRQEFPEGDGSFFAVREKWENLDYHGET